MNQIKSINVKNKRNKNNPLFQNCKLCMYNDTCVKDINCEYLTPVSDKYSDELINLLKENNIPDTGSYFVSPAKDSKTSDDGVPAIYEYYRSMINDCLKMIRSGLTAYVYNEDSVKDILRFEPDVHIILHNDIFYIKKPII